MTILAAWMNLVTASYKHADQPGFLENRYLKDNFQKLYNIIDDLTGSSTSALFYFVDAKRCSTDFMKCMIQRMRVGERYMARIALIYN